MKPSVGGDVQDLPLGPRRVTGLQGRPVADKAPTKNQALGWNGSQWVPTTISAGSTSPLTTKGDIWGYSSVDARVPVGSNGNVLTADSSQTLGVKWAPAGATLSSVDATLAANVTMTTNGTFYDGPSGSFATGTWFIVYKVLFEIESAATGQFSAKLWDGTTVYDESENDVFATATTTFNIELFGVAVVVLGSTATLKVSCVSNHNGSIMLRDINNGASPGNTHTATRLSGIKIA